MNEEVNWAYHPDALFLLKELAKAVQMFPEKDHNDLVQQTLLNMGNKGLVVMGPVEHERREDGDPNDPFYYRVVDHANLVVGNMQFGRSHRLNMMEDPKNEKENRRRRAMLRHSLTVAAMDAIYLMEDEQDD